LTAASLDSCGGIWVPELGPAIKILDLAEHLIRNAGLRPGGDIPITFIGLRAGDKMVEQLVSTRESSEDGALCGLHRVKSPQLSLGDLETAIAELTESSHRRDLAALIRVLCRIVPEYQPSAALLELSTPSEIRTSHA
jgi:FlaA1/EpsC-like NDP-sugar epimerase